MRRLKVRDGTISRVRFKFCRSSGSYVTALDRYGDVLNQTTPTVGDVKDAGKDLQQPTQAAITAPRRQ